LKLWCGPRPFPRYPPGAVPRRGPDLKVGASSSARRAFLAGMPKREADSAAPANREVCCPVPDRPRVTTQVTRSKSGRLKMAEQQAHSLTTAEKYRCHAAECLRLAESTSDNRSRATLLGMAVSWAHLAERAERNSRDDVVYETSPPRGHRSGHDRSGHDRSGHGG
jgi:hypothetical protein